MASPSETPSDPNASLEDVELMIRVRDHCDKRAFQTLFERHESPLYGFLYRLCFNHTWTEDLTQGTFLRLWRARHHYVPMGSFRTYLYQIAKNHYFNEFAKEKTRGAGLSLESLGGEDSLRLDLPSHEPQPHEKLQAGELNERLWQALEALDEKHRAVFVMARLQHQKYSEIARTLGIPVGTVKSRMNFAIKVLAEKLRIHDQGEASATDGS